MVPVNSVVEVGDVAGAVGAVVDVEVGDVAGAEVRAVASVVAIVGVGAGGA